MAVTRSDIEKLAELAKLSFSEDEIDTFASEMDQIIAFADTINQSVEGSADRIRTVSTHSVDSELLREDEVVESLENDRILSNVEGRDGFFVVTRCVK